MDFFAKYSSAYSKILYHLANSHFSDAQMLAHTIKGTGANLGLIELANASREIEYKCSLRLTPSNSELENFKNEINKLSEIAKKSQKEKEKQKNIKIENEISKEQEINLTRKLLSSIYDDYTTLKSDLDTLLKSTHHFEADIKKIEYYIHNFELEKAEELILKIIK